VHFAPAGADCALHPFLTNKLSTDETSHVECFKTQEYDYWRVPCGN